METPTAADDLAILTALLDRVAAGDLSTPGREAWTDAVPADGLGEAALRAVDRLRDLGLQAAEHERFRIRGRLAASLAHEFGNLLAVIVGHAEALVYDEEGGDPERRREGLEAIRRAALEGKDLVHRFQRFMRAPMPARTPAAVDPGRIIAEALVLTAEQRRRAEAAGARHALHTDVLPVSTLHVPPAALREVLAALVANALEAMPEGGRLEVRVREADGEVRFAVADTGPGIPAAIRASVVEPFFTTKPAPAAGLGLTVASRLVADMGGALELADAPGHGTVATVRLPVARPAGRTPDAPRLPATPAVSRVLVIDDDAELRETLGQLLRRCGYTVAMAANGFEGIERYRRERFDCVVTDLKMPGVSGLTVSRAIKDQDPRAFVILLTGWSSDIDEREFAAAGVDRVITKPVTRDQLLQVLAGVAPAGDAPVEAP
jgi:signal transduction histidine kinase/CheY-like chemotaxis protein